MDGLTTTSILRLLVREEDKAAAVQRIRTGLDYAVFGDCDMVIEAATENVDLKIRILKQLDALLPTDTLVATNTSSISITQLAAVTQRADRFIGMHFFNPVPLMTLVELIRGLQTSDDTHAKVKLTVSATVGGGMYLKSSATTVEESTIENNVATRDGAGIAV